MSLTGPGKLIVKPLSAKLTHDTETFGKMDPYCKISLGGELKKSKTHQEAGKYPTWNDSFTFQRNMENCLNLEVWDEDTISRDDLVGETSISLAEVFEKKKLQNWYVLSYKGKEAGKILVALEWQPDEVGKQQGLRPSIPTMNYSYSPNTIPMMGSPPMYYGQQMGATMPVQMSYPAMPGQYGAPGGYQGFQRAPTVAQPPGMYGQYPPGYPQNQPGQQPPYQQGPYQSQPPVGYQQPPSGPYQQPPSGPYQQPPSGPYQQPPSGPYQQPPGGPYQQPGGQYPQPPAGQYQAPPQGQPYPGSSPQNQGYPPAGNAQPQGPQQFPGGFQTQGPYPGQQPPMQQPPVQQQAAPGWGPQNQDPNKFFQATQTVNLDDPNKQLYHQPTVQQGYPPEDPNKQLYHQPTVQQGYPPQDPNKQLYHQPTVQQGYPPQDPNKQLYHQPTVQQNYPQNPNQQFPQQGYPQGGGYDYPKV